MGAAVSRPPGPRAYRAYEAVGAGAGNEGSINRELTWEEFEHLVRVKILDAGRREEICADCRWNELCR